MIGDESQARAWMRSLPEWTDQAGEKLNRLAALLHEENQQQNLVAAATLPMIWQRHFADSAQLLAYVPRGTPDWLDLGTGAGFPGLIVAILRPETRVAMVESRARRVDWLERAKTVLSLDNATIVGSRVELAKTAEYSAISARAFAPLPKLLELASRFSTKDTVWVLPKGRSAAQELQQLQGWNHMFHVEQSVTDAEAGVIVGRLEGRKGRKP